MRSVCALFAGIGLTFASLTAAAVSCSSGVFGSGFLPAGPFGTAGRVPLICGLPASQNPVVGAMDEEDRLRNDQLKDWRRILSHKPSTTAPPDHDPNIEIIAPKE